MVERQNAWLYPAQRREGRRTALANTLPTPPDELTARALNPAAPNFYSRIERRGFSDRPRHTVEYDTRRSVPHRKLRALCDDIEQGG